MSNNILTVIDELGALIHDYKDKIRFKDYEIERLNKKIESIEIHLKEKQCKH